MRPDAPITLAQFQSRFFPSDKGTRRARWLMRQMRHVKARGEMWTTEQWVAAWLAEKEVRRMPAPKAVNYDPLEEAVIERAVRLISDLAGRGVIKVQGGAA